MAWYSDERLYRHPVTVYVDTTGTNDVTIAIPALLERFWLGVDDDGYSVVVTEADGVTTIAHDMASWNKANRTGTIELDDVSLTRGVTLMWVYFGAPSGVTLSDPTTSITPATPVSGYMYAGAPGPDRIVAQRPEPTDTEPRQEIAIRPTTDDDRIWLAWDMSPMLADAMPPGPYGRPYWQEVAWIGDYDDGCGFYQSATQTDEAQFDVACIRAAYDRGRLWLVTPVFVTGTAADLDDYEGRLVFAVADPGQPGCTNTRTAGVLLRVRQLSE